MAKGVNQFTNDQDVLMTVGPFMSLDTTSAPYLVPPTNCVSQFNVAINRVYGAFSTVQGRVANFIGSTFPGPILAIGIGNTLFLPPSNTGYVPAVYIWVGTPTGAQMYLGGYDQGWTLISSWVNNGLVYQANTNYQDSKFVFAGLNVFLDAPQLYPQMITSFSGIEGYTAVNWGIVGPTFGYAGITVTGSVGSGNLVGAYNYAITYINASNPNNIIESSPSPFPNIFITATNQSITLNTIQTSSDPQVTGRNIYRIGGTIGGTALLVGTINDNTTTTYNDNLADNSVVGQQMILRQDPAPSGGWQSIAYHKGRMWGFGSLGPSLYSFSANVMKSDLWYSNYLQPTSFNSVTQVLDCGTDATDYPMALATLDSVLLALKQQSCWIIYGDSQNDFITRRLFSIGCVSKGSVAVGYGKVFWLSADGVYFFDGVNAPTNISDGSIAQGSIRTAINTLLASANSADNPDVGVRGFITNRTYYLSIYSLQNSVTPVTYAYDLVIGAWTQLSFSAQAIVAANGLFYTQNGSPFVSGKVGYSLVLGTSTATNTSVDQWFAAETDYGNAVVASWTSGISDSGLTGVTKEYRYIEVIAPTQGVYVNVTLLINPGLNQTQLGPYQIYLGTGSNRHRQSLPPSATGYECQVIITTQTYTQTVINKVSVLGYAKRAESPPPGTN